MSPRADSGGMRNKGFVLLVLIITIMPLMLLVIAMTSLQVRRSKALQADVQQERAFNAAEAGLIWALHLRRIGQLEATSSKELSPGLGFTVTMTADGVVDSLGYAARARYRLGATIVSATALPNLRSALSFQNPDVNLRPMSLTSTLVINGGIAVSGPEDATFLDGFDEDQVVGNPRLGFTDDPIDLSLIVDAARASATITVTGSVRDVDWGTEESPVVVFADGDLSVAGDSDGFGILVVTGNLQLKDDFTFHGVIVVLGSVNLKDEAAELESGASWIMGAILHGGTSFKIKGQTTVTYDASAIDSSLLPVSGYRLTNWRRMTL